MFDSNKDWKYDASMNYTYVEYNKTLKNELQMQDLVDIGMISASMSKIDYNGFTNSSQYTPEGLRVDCEVSHVHKDAIEIRIIDYGGQLANMT